LQASNGREMSTSYADNPVIERGPLSLDLERWTVFVAGRRVELSVAQLRLVAVLARRPGVVFSREQLLEAVWGADSLDKEPQSIDVLVCRLRRKLGPQARHLIETVHSLGYRFSSGTRLR
jgi:DNA-binding response OmpR family regulator